MSKIIRNGIEYGGTATTANQVQYSPTETVADKIDELNEAIEAITPSDTVLTAAWTASSSTAGNTVLTNDLTLPKGMYLLIVAYPVLGNTDLFVSGIDGSNISSWGGSFINLASQQNSLRFVKANANTAIRLKSMQSFSQTFSYLERGGLFAYKLI